MKALTFKTITDLDSAKEIWNSFSAHKKLDDEWDFRYTWVKELNYPLQFIVGYDKDKPVGLLPLQLNNNTGISQKLLKAHKPFLEFFGGVDTDDNHIILLPGYEDHPLDFLREVKSYAILTDMETKYDEDGFKSEYYLDRFELDLVKIPDFTTFLQTNFDGISRQRLVNRLNKINKTHKVTVEEAKDKLDLLFEMNMQRFGNDSSFHMQYRQNVYKEFLNIFDADVFTISLDNKLKAISYSIIYRDTYTSINLGYDLEVRDLQKLLVTTQIKRALEKGCKVFDAGQGNNGWKEHFHLTKIPQYRLDLND